MRVKPDPSQIAEIYIDESSQTQHRYLVLGGIVVSLSDSNKLCDLIIKARLPDLPAKEAKWTKVSRAKLPAYMRIVDILFDNPDLAHFHCLVVDTTLQDHKRWNEASREIGFNKEIYQLARKFSRIYKESIFHLYPDHRTTIHTPDELKLIVNRSCRKDGDTRDWPFRRCQFRDSDTTLPLQLTDIIIGSIAYHLNSHAKSTNASAAKLELSHHVLTRAGISNVMRDTNRVGRFTIWHRQLKKRVSQP
jgi:hypothetical protein